MSIASSARRIRRSLFLQVVIALIIGIVVGVAFPHLAMALKPLGDGFIKLIKMVIAPLIFLIVVHGISSHSDLARVGRIAGKTILYFELVTCIALALGIAVATLCHLGSGMHVVPASLADGSQLGGKAHQLGGVSDFFLGLIPDTFLGAFARGDVLQVLVLSVLVGIALLLTGDTGRPLVDGVDRLLAVVFRLMGMLVALAPLGVLGAVAYMVGRYGLGSLTGLLEFLVVYYLACIGFVVVVLGIIARLAGVGLWQLMAYLREELSIVFGTTASDVVLPQIMRKLEWLGIDRATVGLVIPTGYSFNLDGFSMYLTLAVVFVANATGTALGWEDLLLILGVAMITSKGAHGVPGSALVIMAATLAAIPAIPPEALALLLPIDWFVGIGRALTNVLGNCVATLVIARWEGELDVDRANTVLSGQLPYDPQHVNEATVDG